MEGEIDFGEIVMKQTKTKGRMIRIIKSDLTVIPCHRGLERDQE